MSKLNMLVQDEKNAEISYGYIFSANEKNISDY